MHVYIYSQVLNVKRIRAMITRTANVVNTIFMEIHYSLDIVKRFKACIIQSSFVNGKETMVII